MASEIGMQTVLVLGVAVVGAVAALWLLRKIVKLAVTLLAVAAVVAVALVYCVKAGYLSREDVAKLNPFRSETIRQLVKDAGAWSGAAVRKGVDVVVDEALDHAVPKSAPAR